MKSTSIDAYDLPDRVQRYDADMDVMHPLRHKMIDIACEVIPFADSLPLRVLDLGIGTGVFTRRILERYPRSTVVAIDGAAAMLELAKSRLGLLAARVQWVQSDFLAMPAEVLRPDSLDLVISSYALHHLDARQKRSVLQSVVAALKPGGWLVNADILVAADDVMERRLQEIRVAGVTARAAAGDQRFSSIDTTRVTLEELGAAEHDQPQTLETDVRLLRESGLHSVEVFWKEYREAVTGGCA